MSLSFSPKPAVLITGGSGLLALNWARILKTSWSVYRIAHSRQVDLAGTSEQLLDLASLDELASFFKLVRPRLVIHTAGMTNVEKCEADPDGAMFANALIAENVASTCSQFGVRLVHISTDHLFDGRSALRTETCTPAPLNVYARTKAEGEERVLAATESALVVRTNFFGWGPRYRQSFSDWILNELRNGREISLFEDVFITPILIDILVEIVHQLIDKGATGVVNVVGDDRLSKYDFGVQLADVFSLDRTLVRRGRLANQQHLVVRPFDMSLSNARVRRMIGRNIGRAADHLRQLAALEQDPEVNAVGTL